MKLFQIRIKRKKNFNRQLLSCESIESAEEFAFHELIMTRYYHMDFSDLRLMDGEKITYSTKTITERNGTFHAYFSKNKEKILFEIKEIEEEK